MAEAPSLQSTFKQYEEDGLIVIQMLAENNSGTTPTTEDLESWAASSGQTHPVVADAGWAVSNRFEVDYGIPTFSLLAPGMEVVTVDDWASESVIPDVLPPDFELPVQE